MISIRLGIRHQTKRKHATAAWLLAGSDPAIWLAELIQCGFALESLRLYPLPTSKDDRTVAGVLVVPQTDNPSVQSRLHDRAKPTTVPYGVVADRLYLPADADLQPQIDDRELASLFSPDVAAYVFHPTIGLVEVEDRSVLRVRDLLRLPANLASDWDAARPGLKINERLLSIELADPPSITTIFQEVQGDIGSRSAFLSQLPPGASEPSDGPISNLGRGITSGVAKATLWLTSFAPPNASKPTWINSFRDWASSQLAGVGQAIDSIRNKEIRRLLDLLANDPDEGLRYAIPLDGPAHRGTAPPTNRLGRRPVDFSLSRLGGGSAADSWRIEHEYFTRLRQSYRELAAREANLGRHRRAAYIYAELLNDLNAAASALKDGGHHREAAVLYRDRLNRPLDAANCLEDGGLLGEAISLFEELKEHERAGDLHRRLDQPEEALDAYRLAADAHATSGDLMSAARILDAKMELPDRAIEALQAGWPNSGQAERCLQSLFQLLARLGRHDAARDRVLALRDERYAAKQTQLAAAAMALTATTYPSDEVRALAADACRVVVGRNLPGADVTQQRQLLQTIEQLASEDRLLQRDCSRFGRRWVAPKFPQAAPSRPTRHPEPTLVAQFTLPRGVQWQMLVAANEWFYAAGYQDNSLAVIRGDWTGNMQLPEGQLWPVHPAAITSRRRIMLAPPVSDFGEMWIHCSLIDPVLMPPRTFPPCDQFPKRAVVAPFPGAQTAAVARGPSGVEWVLTLERDGTSLTAYRLDGRLIRSISLSPGEPEGWNWLSRVLMHATHEAIYVASGIGLLRVGNNGEQSTEAFMAPIKSLTGTLPHTRPRLAIGFQQGGYVLWPIAGIDGEVQAFGQDLSDFEICFTKGGALVAVAASGGEIYSTQDGRVELIATLKGSGESPLAVVPTAHLKQFAVCMPSGAVRVYQLP